MKGRFWRKALAAALALLVVSGNVPIRSVANLFGSAAITASAEEAASGQCGENAFWSFDTATGKLTISGTGAMKDYYDNGDQPWNDYRENITSVEIENGVTSIGKNTFFYCKSLTSITIPDSVKSIGEDAFSYCKSLTSITIPDSVTSIGMNAFYECTGLTSITIPDSVTSIGKDAFDGCTNITDVYCYADPNNLEWNEFCCDDFIRSETGKPTICHVREEYLDTYNSEKFSDVNVTFKAEKMDKCGDHAYWCFESDIGKLTIFGTGAMYDYEYDGDTETVNSPWFAYKDNITSVVIENGITSIGNFEFFSCTGLTSITIPDSVKSIGGQAFSCCEGLTSITIPDSVESIGEDAFYNCTNITDVYCYADPNNLEWNEVDCDDFNEDGLTVCHVREEHIDTYNSEKFSGKVNVKFKAEAMGKCGDHAYWCFESDARKLTISGTGTMYDYGYTTQPWYNYIDNITSVKIENGITSIGNSAFDSCAYLTSITIPDSVKSIGGDAFYECTSLKSVTIPDSVKSIGGDAFYLCQNITDVYCYADPDKLTWDEGGCDDFKEDGSTVCHVPEEYIETYNTKFGAGSETPVNVTFKAEPMGKCGGHAYWLFDPDTSKLTISGTGDILDYEFNYETGTIDLPWYVYQYDITSVEIEKGITSIANDAFSWCTSLTSVTIPDSVTSIGNGAFVGCIGLTSIEIPNSVTSIGTDAFYYCTNITDVYCYADPDKLTWNEDCCDDFMGAEESRETICHVPKMYLEDYEAKFGAGSETPVNVRFVGDVDMGLGDHLYGHSITLDGSIGVNFFVELTDELLESETAQMAFTVPNGSKTDTQTLLVKDVIANDKNKVSIGSKTYYKFKCSVSAKDMASEITAQLVDGDKAGTEYKYSVKEYANYLLAHPEVEEYGNAAPLVKAMLNYGAASQTYFKEGTAVGEVQDMTDVTVPNTFKFDEDNADLPEGVTFEGATLSLKSETTLSLYFKGLPADTKFTCDGKTVETAKNGEYVVARIRGIKASELENDFTVTFKGVSMKYNAMAYCYNVLNGGSNDAALQNVCKALYLYAQAAINYAG